MAGRRLNLDDGSATRYRRFRESVPIARVDQWQLGDVQLPSGDVAVVDLPDAQHGGGGLEGVIGSDVLSRFAYVVVDYGDRRLGLSPA